MDDCHVPISCHWFAKNHCYVPTHYWSLPNTWKFEQSIIYEEAVQCSATGVFWKRSNWVICVIVGIIKLFYVWRNWGKMICCSGGWQEKVWFQTLWVKFACSCMCDEFMNNQLPLFCAWVWMDLHLFFSLKRWMELFSYFPMSCIVTEHRKRLFSLFALTQTTSSPVLSPLQGCLALRFRTNFSGNVFKRREAECFWLTAHRSQPHWNGSGCQRAQLWAVNLLGSAWLLQENNMRGCSSDPASFKLELSVWTWRQRARHGHVPRKATSR